MSTEKHDSCPACGKKSYAQGFCQDLQHCHHCGWNYTGAVEKAHHRDIELKKYLENQGYYNVRILGDGIICNNHFIFTTAVLVGLTYTGYDRRICYPKGSGLAEKMCLQMVSVDDVPLPGYTALK